jgi:hypothetical protein
MRWTSSWGSVLTERNLKMVLLDVSQVQPSARQDANK